MVNLGALLIQVDQALSLPNGDQEGILSLRTRDTGGSQRLNALLHHGHCSGAPSFSSVDSQSKVSPRVLGFELGSLAVSTGPSCIWLYLFLTLCLHQPSCPGNAWRWIAMVMVAMETLVASSSSLFSTLALRSFPLQCYGVEARLPTVSR